jgi:Fic family protein
MNHLLAVSQRATWIEWIQFFLRGVAEQSQDAFNRLNRLQSLWKEYREKMQTMQISALCLQIVDELFRYPAVSVTSMAARLEVTHRTAQLNVNKLVEAGILKEISDRKRNRIYAAPEIISAIEA